MSTNRDPFAVRQSVHVACSIEDAFVLFTERIGDWWPLRRGYTYGGDRAREIFLEPRVRGRFYERFVDGDELQVGSVLTCEPPHRIVFSWRGTDWEADTEVDVRFVAEQDGTRVDLEHRRFERLGPIAFDVAAQFGGGWPRVLGAFAEHVSAARKP